MSPIQDIAFVRYQVTDLDRMETFLADFGLHRAQRTPQALYMRTAGSSPVAHVSVLGDTPATLGYGFTARSEQALNEIASQVGAVVEDNPEPGGGQRVRFKDPAGFIVDVLHGQTPVAPLPVREPCQVNPASGRQRLGRTVRLKPQPSGVMRLGHVAVLVSDFPAGRAFYERVLGLRASDTYWAGHDGNTIAAFMHCGLGEQWTDHHTLALISSPDGSNRFDHAAFEVIDLDDLMQGGEWLRSRGYRHAWGVGRHIQGSQLFDYWRDPFGNKIEHWTDGDLVNDTTPVGHAPISNDELRQWAPPITPEFFA